jgi:hypothetical protein
MLYRLRGTDSDAIVFRVHSKPHKWFILKRHLVVLRLKSQVPLDIDVHHRSLIGCVSGAHSSYMVPYKLKLFVRLCCKTRLSELLA